MKVIREGVEVDVKRRDLTPEESRLYMAAAKARQRERDRIVKAAGADPQDVRAIAKRAAELRALKEQRAEKERIERMSQEVAANASAAKKQPEPDSWDAWWATISPEDRRDWLRTHPRVLQLQYESLMKTEGAVDAEVRALIVEQYGFTENEVNEVIAGTYVKPADSLERENPVLSAGSILGPDPIKRAAHGNEAPGKTDIQIAAQAQKGFTTA